MDRPTGGRTERAEAKPADAASGRVPPYNKDAEAAVIGGILLNNEALFLVQEVLGPEDFYVETHRRIYTAIQELSRGGLPVDHVTLGNELRKRGDLEKIGGPMALDGLTDRVATVANVEHYARIVREKASVRRMIYAAQQVVADGFSEIDSAEDFLDGAEASVFQAAQYRVGTGYTHVTPVVHKTINDLQEASGRKGEISGVPSGFPLLDRKTAGFQRSDLIIVAGRPSMGKTALALNIAFNATEQLKRPVIVFSLEMARDQLVRRLLSSIGKVDASRMRANNIHADDWPRLIQAADQLTRSSIYLDDSAPMTPIEIRAKARRLKSEKGLALVVVDYMQLMRAGGRRADNRQEEISEISRSLKSLARELEVPVIALSQLNRGVEGRTDKRPMMSDLRESGAIEQDADLILFVYRDEIYNPQSDDRGLAEIIIGKQRSGPMGDIKLRFAAEFTRFDNLAPEEAPTGAAGTEAY
jgi:replicative DNA helicase